MRYVLLATTTALVLATPTIATAGTPGFVDVRLGSINIESVELTTAGIGGSVVAPLSGNWNVQVDGELTRFDFGDETVSGSALVAHVFQDTGDWAVGALLGYQGFDAVSFWTLGAEAQYTVGAFVLEVGLGIGTGEAASDNVDKFSADASATWYASADLSFTGGIYFFDWDYVDVTDYSLDVEYRFAGSPFSVIGGYTFTDYENGNEGDAWSIGLRYAFGDSTLQARRNEGPRWLREDSAPVF